MMLWEMVALVLELRVGVGCRIFPQSLFHIHSRGKEEHRQRHEQSLARTRPLQNFRVYSSDIMFGGTKPLKPTYERPALTPTSTTTPVPRRAPRAGGCRTADRRRRIDGVLPSLPMYVPHTVLRDAHRDPVGLS